MYYNNLANCNRAKPVATEFLNTCMCEAGAEMLLYQSARQALVTGAKEEKRRQYQAWRLSLWKAGISKSDIRENMTGNFFSIMRRKPMLL